eukprot:1035106-Pelagomonas_calceolata.AAC.1
MAPGLGNFLHGPHPLLCGPATLALPHPHQTCACVQEQRNIYTRTKPMLAFLTLAHKAGLLAKYLASVQPTVMTRIQTIDAPH